MGMEIPGILKTAGTPEALVKDPQYPPTSERRDPRVQPPPPSREDIERQARALEDTFQAFNHQVRLSVNEEINQVVIKVVDARTDKVIKEIPAEEIQRTIARIREAIGLLVDEKI